MGRRQFPNTLSGTDAAPLSYAANLRAAVQTLLRTLNRLGVAAVVVEAIARTAHSMRWPITPEVGVLCVERVASGTMSAATVDATGIRLDRNRFQVPGIDAGSVLTEVIEYETGRDWPNQHFVGDAMGEMPAVIDSDSTVAICVAIPDPHPTVRVDTDFRPEPIPERSIVIHGGFLLRRGGRKGLARSRVLAPII